jgi:hypothetical protein
VLELLLIGVVSLADAAQIDAARDPEAPPKRRDLLLRIEGAYRAREDDGAVNYRALAIGATAAIGRHIN